MRIDVIKQINDEYREVWCFNVFDFSAVFVGWKDEVKPKGKRKWIMKSKWDTYDKRGSSAKEPELPLKIKEDAISQICELIKAYTWEEWKR